MSRQPFVCLFLAAAFTIAGARASDGNSVPQNERFDTAPATLHYWQWRGHPGLAMVVAHRARADSAAHRVAGEKLDSGLGELPHFEQWSSHPDLAPLALYGTRAVAEVSVR